MNPASAHRLARRSHVDQHNRFGEPVIEHVQRVAAAVPSEARVIAWLHDLLELCPGKRRELPRHGLTSAELTALELLTHAPEEPYEHYVGRIGAAPGASRPPGPDREAGRSQRPSRAPLHSFGRAAVRMGVARSADQPGTNPPSGDGRRATGDPSLSAPTRRVVPTPS